MNNSKKESVTLITIGSLYLVVIGLIAYFAANVNALNTLKDWTGKTFNSIKGPYIVFSIGMLFLSVSVNILGYYLLSLSHKMVKEYQEKKKNLSQNTIIYVMFYKANIYKELINISAVIGIFTLLMAEIFTQLLLTIFIMNFVIEHTSSVGLKITLLLILVVGTYHPIQKLIKWLYVEGRVPFFKRTKNATFIHEGDEEKIKSWSILLCAIFTGFTVLISIFGLLDSETLNTLNKDLNITTVFYIGISGILVSALRMTKGNLKVF